MHASENDIGLRYVRRHGQNMWTNATRLLLTSSGHETEPKLLTGDQTRSIGPLTFSDNQQQFQTIA